ncbi:MAG: sigma-54-dependent Fis family transcriptional regulator [Pirellula sp.]|nr:sigma-54-dependent Fis family transcriptional regulator [Pirellula sp.]
MPVVYSYLTVTLGRDIGQNYVLDPEIENRIGRGTECTIQLNDPLCSRVHAIVKNVNGRWEVRDLESRNGTFVNDRKIDDSTLGEGHYLKLGSTEFQFHQSRMRPTLPGDPNVGVTQSIVARFKMGSKEFDAADLGAIHSVEQTQDLLLLHQLSIKLLSCSDPQQCLHFALELVQGRTKASVVGFLSVGDDRNLRPKIVLPDYAQQRVNLSEDLMRLVCDEGHAVWIANQKNAEAEKATSHFSDAQCIPLVSGKRVLGAFHLYLEDGRFRQSHFDFAVSAANITAQALARAYHEESLSTDNQRLKEISGSDELVGESPPMLDLKARIARVASAGGCVLIRGESGSGKELVARAVHRQSARADRPMLSINCAAIPADLIESQLFGHRAGSFTGADRDHDGLFKQADMGTLFLDEIGELTPAGQAKLLRILEGHPFLPVGATTEVQVDVRVIAATNRDLALLARERKFREDLYYRLNVFELHVPPLRERGSDVGRLIDHFLDHFGRAHGRPGIRLSDAARSKLLGYAWPGNVRQLRNTIDSAVVMAAGPRIEAGDLMLQDVGGQELDTLEIEVWERKLILEALKRTGGNVPEAAKMLGIGRATLYRKLEQYGIER